MSLKISVVLPTYNRRWLLEKSLPTILRQDLPTSEYEVIVVVDGSTDGSAECARGAGPCVRVIEQPNRGLAAARNAGWRAARAPLVLFIDDDILCSLGLVRAHIAAHAGPRPSVVKGAVRNAPDSPPSLASDWAFAYGEEWMTDIGKDLRVPWPRHATLDANASVPRAALEQVGGYDESLRAREQVDMALRLGKLGLDFYYAPDAVGWHYYARTAREIVDRDASLYGAEEVVLCRRHPEFRPHSALARLGEGGWLKRAFRAVAAGDGLVLHQSLRAPLRAAGWLRRFPPLREAGIRLLQASIGSAIFAHAAREAGGWTALENEFGRRLPVLVYHNVAPTTGRELTDLTVSPERFACQIQWVKVRGYTAIRTAEWLGWVKEGRVLPPKPVLITFDRAYASIAQYAFPVLERYGFPATVFTITHRRAKTLDWDHEPAMTAEQIRGWAAKGIEFGGHTRTHPDLRFLAPVDLEDEIAGSGKDLDELLAQPAIAFAYPHGYHSAAAVATARASFRLAFGTAEGLNSLTTDLHLLKRTMVQPGDILPVFALRVWLGYSPIHQLRTRLLRLLLNAKRRLASHAERTPG